MTESKLQRIEETVSVKVSRGGVRSGVTSLLPSFRPAGEKHSGLLGFRIEGRCPVKVELCRVPL